MDDMTSLQSVIEDAWERRTELAPASAPAAVKAAVEKVIAQLDAGKVRVAEKQGGEWSRAAAPSSRRTW